MYNDKYLEPQVHYALYLLKGFYNQMLGFHAMTLYLVPTIGIILGRNSVLILCQLTSVTVSHQNDCHWVFIEKMSFTMNLFINGTTIALF